MKINAERYGRAVMLLVNGEITEDTLEAFRKAVDHQLEGGEALDVILNLEEVPFIDSAGLECLLDLQDQLATRMGQIRLVNCPENILKILEITRLSSAFEVHKDAAEAVKAVQT